MSGPWYFAWAGGSIEPQITLVTNGDTHGARPVLATLVADIPPLAGLQQLQNLASTQGLETGTLYELSGPGIAGGTYFIFDDSILSGLPGAVNLTAQAGGAYLNTQFIAQQSNNVGVVLATLTAGSSSIAINSPLPAGRYGAFGTGIGETNIPIGTTTGTTHTSGGGVMIIGSCFLIADGAGGAQLSIMAATPNTHTAYDAYGQEIVQTSYSIAAQAVRATTSGEFPISLTGFPSGDPLVVDNIPTSALQGLTPGLLYNITGNGIQVGSTFVAPNGGSSVELDLYTTATQINAILTITGPRTPNAPFDPAVHNRFDEDILTVEIAQEEGGLATLTVDMKNPNVGLLAIGRNLWCWLSWDQAWSPGGTAAPDLVPLINGRLIGVPQLQANEVVRLQFLARPEDLNAQKLNLADELSGLPFYDPIWFDNPATADTVLETYSALYHIDPATLAVTVSDILEGEDGTIPIGEDQAIYDRFSLAYGQPPLVAVTVSGTVAWQQQAEGTLDVTQAIISAFHAAGSAYSTVFPEGAFKEAGGGLISCLCGDGLKSDWPKPGTSIGGGWSLSTLNDGSGYPLCYIVDAIKGNQGGWILPTNYTVTYSSQGTPNMPMQDPSSTTDQSNVNVFLAPFGQTTVLFPLNVYKIRMNLNYRADRRRTETVTAVLTAAVQSELSDSTENDRDSIALTSEYVGQAIDEDGQVPIGDVAYRSYFQTDRGDLSFQYLLLAARAKMRARARSVDVTFAVDWRTALGITLRHNVQLTDRRLPGGICTGKVKSLRLTASDSTMLGEFVIGCTIGTGDAASPQPGVPVWADPGYVNSSYQVLAGDQLAPAGNADFYYQSLDDFQILDDGLDLTNLSITQALNECAVANGLITQVPAMASFQGLVFPTHGDPVGIMRTMTTTVTLDLKPLQGAEYHTDFYPALTQLALPKTIDLSAGGST